MLGPGYPIDLLLYADDLEALRIGAEGRKGMPLSYLLLSVLGYPFKWAKTRGGYRVEWLGMETEYSSRRGQVCEEEVANYVTTDMNHCDGRPARFLVAAPWRRARGIDSPVRGRDHLDPKLCSRVKHSLQLALSHGQCQQRNLTVFCNNAEAADGLVAEAYDVL